MKFRTEYRGGRLRLLEDPRGADVLWNYGGREYLGRVRDCYFDEVCGVTRLRVRYFCGEEWPEHPLVTAVEVLERAYESGDES